MKKWLYRLFIELTNHQFSSFLLRSFAQSTLSRYLIPTYANVYRINQTEIKNDLKSFSTLHDLFIRQLKVGVRPINSDATSIVSPVDAVIEEVGTILPSKTILVKEKTYSIAEMLGDKEALDKYVAGTFLILYLSPSHYHRIHSPVTGKITKQWTLGRRSYPVNKLGLKYGKDTLSKNFRKITEVEFHNKHLAIVKVGAMFVNSIEITHQSDRVEKGQEIAYFTFGSTVILLFEKDSFELNNKLIIPSEVKVGEVLGHFK